MTEKLKKEDKWSLSEKGKAPKSLCIIVLYYICPIAFVNGEKIGIGTNMGFQWHDVILMKKAKITSLSIDKAELENV